MAHVIFYEKPGCGGNARQKQALLESGHSVEARDLLSHHWSEAELLAFFRARPVAEWFNRASPRVKSGEVVPERVDAATALAMMRADPLLIRRPLLQVGNRCEAGWSEAVIHEWIGLSRHDVAEGCPKGEAHRPCPTPPAGFQPL
ncbi:MAG TPA: ArsC/Spx/MgsR family protein [Magnetospirillum sp.]|nr:ArsC/Spx/MgsR family protein [Magnetospirillum sp.]